jgi:hypothetical protein
MGNSRSMDVRVLLHLIQKFYKTDRSPKQSVTISYSFNRLVSLIFSFLLIGKFFLWKQLFLNSVSSK